MPPADQILICVVRRNAIARPSRWIAAKTSATTKVAINCGSAWAASPAAANAGDAARTTSTKARPGLKRTACGR